MTLKELLEKIEESGATLDMQVVIAYDSFCITVIESVYIDGDTLYLSE